MTDAPAFLSVEQVLVIHQRMIEEFGGDGAVRDYGLLASAVTMPSAQFGGRFLHEGVPRMAAAYVFHLCKNHSFVDGNKRTALAAAEVFLSVNGYRLDADDAQVENVMLGAAEGRLSKEDVAEFFVEHTVLPG